MLTTDHFTKAGSGQTQGKHSKSNVRFSRSPTNGASTIVVTDNDPAAAQRHALALAEYIWSERAEWDAPPITKEQAVLEGMPPLGKSSLSW
jgi:microcystin degradation protein MlrC